MGEFFDLILIDPISNILLAVYKALFFLHIPYSLGFAIIILTIIFRFAMYPLMSSQIRSSKKMHELNPHLSKIKDRHKGDAKRLQQETMKLYKEHGINPAAGCLPVLIQLPIIWALYSVLQKIVTLKPEAAIAEVNKIVYFDFLKLKNAWDISFFGLPLGEMPSKIMSFNNLFAVSSLILLVPILTGVFQFILSKMMIPAKTGVAILEKDIEKKTQIDKKDASDFASAFQTQSM